MLCVGLTLKFLISLFLKIANEFQYRMCYKCDFLEVLEVGSNCGIFKQALENSLNQFHCICGSQDVATKIY